MGNFRSEILSSISTENINYPELKNITEKLAREYQPKFTLIEDKANGQQLV